MGCDGDEWSEVARFVALRLGIRWNVAWEDRYELDDDRCLEGLYRPRTVGKNAQMIN